jgi:hypothetical protein
MGEVVSLSGQPVGDGSHIDCDAVIQASVGEGLIQVVVIGILPDGDVFTAGSHGLAETLLLLERAKHCILFEE